MAKVSQSCLMVYVSTKEYSSDEGPRKRTAKKKHVSAPVTPAPPQPAEESGAASEDTPDAVSEMHRFLNNFTNLHQVSIGVNDVLLCSSRKKYSQSMPI